MTEPRRESRGTVRIDSGDEQYAYLVTHFGDPGTWTVDSQQLVMTPDGREAEQVELRLESGERHTVLFVDSGTASPFDDGESEPGTDYLVRVMTAATTFSEQNPPHHPGTTARFPVPSRSYAHALSVPMTVLALDRGKRGLYSPPRVVVVDSRTLEVRGVGEFPGFDPENWPPPRLGDWPPASLSQRSPERIQFTMARFSGIWKRLLDAWFASDVVASADLAADAREARELLGILDLPGLEPIYRELNPVFWKWFERHSGAV